MREVFYRVSYTPVDEASDVCEWWGLSTEWLHCATVRNHKVLVVSPMCDISGTPYEWMCSPDDSEISLQAIPLFHFLFWSGHRWDAQLPDFIKCTIKHLFAKHPLIPGGCLCARIVVGGEVLRVYSSDCMDLHMLVSMCRPMQSEL